MMIVWMWFQRSEQERYVLIIMETKVLGISAFSPGLNYDVLASFFGPL